MVKTQREIALIRFNRSTNRQKAPYKTDKDDNVWSWVYFENPLEKLRARPEWHSTEYFQREQVYAQTQDTQEAIIFNKKLLSDLQSGVVRYVVQYHGIPFKFNNEFPNGVAAKLQQTIAWQENYPTFISNWKAKEQIARQKDELLLLTNEQKEEIQRQKIESRNVFTQLTADQAIELTKIPTGETTEKKEQRIFDLQIQDVTFNEQVNSGDFNETPITDINVSGGCSECTGTKSVDPIIKKGYHTMPDGSLMKDTDMEKGNNMKMAGIAAVAVGLGYLILKNK